MGISLTFQFLIAFLLFPQGRCAQNNMELRSEEEGGFSRAFKSSTLLHENHRKEISSSRYKRGIISFLLNKNRKSNWFDIIDDIAFDKFMHNAKLERATRGKMAVQYRKSGSYFTALRDFRSFKPFEVKPINQNGVKGYTGKILVKHGRGKAMKPNDNSQFTISVRNTSTDGSPTLQIEPTLKVEGRPSALKMRYD